MAAAVKRLFVTVGTTRFDALIRMVLSEEFAAVASEVGIGTVTCQIGDSDVSGVAALDGVRRRLDGRSPSSADGASEV